MSAFGFGGTNAHVILREAPSPQPVPRTTERPQHVLALSAKTASALRAQAERLCAFLSSTPDAPLADVCFTANVGRAHFGHRLVIAGATGAEVRDRLAAWLRGSKTPRVHTGYVKPAARLQVCLAFTETDVTPGSARALYDVHPRFHGAMERCGEVLRPHLQQPLCELLYGRERAEARALLQRPSHAHAALVALQCALHAFWSDLGVEPSAVYGAGAGEYAAAAACGVITWQQALVLAARRGLWLEGLAPGAERTRSVRQLKAELAQIDYRAPSVPFVSASLGHAFTVDDIPGEAHWKSHLYHSPGPADAAAALLAEGCDLHLELAPPAPVAARPAPHTWLRVLDEDGDDWARCLDTLSLLHVRGAAIDWHAFDAPFGRRKLSLPTYPFERQRHWLDFPDRSVAKDDAVVIEQPSSHPLFGRVRTHMPGRSGFVRKPGTGMGHEGTG